MPPSSRYANLEPLPTLRELFIGAESGLAQPISLADLARLLPCPPLRLVSLVREGWLRRADGGHSQGAITTATMLERPPDAAVAWLRGWLIPARAKPLFSKADCAELLDCSEREVMSLARQSGVVVTHEAALGVMFSAWAVKRMLVERAGAGEGVRFDRISFMHAILEDSPECALQPPEFSRALESEIARVAQLPEPARSLRAAELLAQFQDARTVIESAAPESSAPSPPESHASGSSGSGSAQRISRLTTICSGMREFS